MIKICPIHYQIDCNILYDFYKQNSKQVHLQMEQAFKYCLENQISVLYNNFFSYMENGVIYIYSHQTLVYQNDISDTFVPVSFTPAFLAMSNMHDTEELERTLLKVISTSFVLAYLTDTRQHKCKKKHGTFYNIYEMKDAPISMKRYECGTDLFYVKEGHNKVSFVCNYVKRVQFSLPNETFIMPNHNPVKVFYEKNTMDIEDVRELNEMLHSVPESLGKCYSTCEAILQAAQKGYAKEHKVEYYAGWMYYIHAYKLTHHAWIVMDDKHIIDMTIKKSGKMIEFMNKSQNGEYMEFSRELLAQWMHDEIEENAPFSKYHFCGKTAECIYIGTQCTKDEAVTSFHNAMSKGLPGYANTPNGGYENKLQKLYNQKYQ